MRHHTKPSSADGQRVLLTLTERIAHGDYLPGVWLPTERSLADEFGVDRSIIRSVLLRLGEQGLIEREPGKRPWVKQLPTPQPTRLAVQNNRNVQHTIAVVVPQHPLYHAASLVLHGLNTELRMEEMPLRVLVHDTYADNVDFSTVLEDNALKEIEQEGAAGLIIWQIGNPTTTKRLQNIQNLGIPVVCVDRFPPEMVCDFVGVDNRVSAVMAVNHLLSLGHRNIAYLTSREETTAVLERRQGYFEALQTVGITPRNEWIFASPVGILPDVKSAVNQFFGTPNPPTAVFAMNDALAHYFIVEVESQGLRVPTDISVMGFDDLERYSLRPALLTTLHQPFDQIGRRATRLLLDRIRSNSTQQQPYTHILLSTTLVERSTCQMLRKEVNE